MKRSNDRRHAHDYVIVALTDCQVGELDLMGATLRRVALDGTRVGSLELHEADLADVDLRRTTLETIGSPRQLAGATISPDQLVLLGPLLAADLGIGVAD